MRKAILSLNITKYIKPSYCLNRNFKVNAINHFSKPHTLTQYPRYTFATDSQVQQQNKLIVPFKGYLTVRNSQTMDLAFETNTKIINVLLGKNTTVEQLKLQIKEKLSAQNVEIVCDQLKLISDLTPLDALLDRNVFLILNNDFSVKIEGQLLRPSVQNDPKTSFQNLQMPLVTRRDIENYTKRISTWIQAKYAVTIDNPTVKIPKNQAKKILIQALLDPQQSNRRMIQKEEQFQKMYWQVQELLDKKSLAVVECSKMVRNRMTLGCLIILANVGFIWSGTYVFYSWDIIQPIAYFISSLSGIILCSRFFKMKRPFTLFNYKQYMIQKYMPIAMKRVGVDPTELQRKNILLAQLQAEIKDYYLKRL